MNNGKQIDGKEAFALDRGHIDFWRHLCWFVVYSIKRGNRRLGWAQ